MKPLRNKENIPILKDESIPLPEKVQYLESFITDAKLDKAKLERELKVLEHYGPNQPTKSDIEFLDRDTAEKIQNFYWEGKIRGLKYKISKAEISIDILEAKKKYYNSAAEKNDTKPTGKPDQERIVDKAIELAVTRMGDQPKVRKVLKKYASAKQANPKRTDYNIFLEDLEIQHDIVSSNFYGWIKKYNEALKLLTHAQDS